MARLLSFTFCLLLAVCLFGATSFGTPPPNTGLKHSVLKSLLNKHSSSVKEYRQDRDLEKLQPVIEEVEKFHKAAPHLIHDSIMEGDLPFIYHAWNLLTALPKKYFQDESFKNYYIAAMERTMQLQKETKDDVLADPVRQARLSAQSVGRNDIVDFIDKSVK